MIKKTPRAIGLNLAFKLYLLLITIVGPTLLIYYIHNFRTIETLHEREVTDLRQLLSYRVEDWLDSYLATLGQVQDEIERIRKARESQDSLQRELRGIVERYPGVDGIAVFVFESTELGGVAYQGNGVSFRPASQDSECSATGRVIDKPIQSGTLDLRTVSVPLAPKDPKSEDRIVRGVLHLRIIPDRIGLGRELPGLRTNLIIGGAGMLLVVGVGVGLFFHVAVRRPIGELTASMEETAAGNFTVHIPSRTGEFGWLGSTYNRMMRRLKSSIDENRQLLDQIRRFNEELQQKIREATEELAAKNLQLQKVNERLFTTQRQMTTMEKLATLGQVATIIAHELGTPLNAISGHLQLLLDGGKGEPRVIDRLRIIDSQVDRLTGIVRNVLRSMRVPPPKIEPVRIDGVIRREAELIEPVARKRGVEVVLELPADLPIIPADPDQLEQVLLNLFTNAVDAMGSGGRLVVTARLAPRDEVLKVAPGVWVPLDNTDHLRIDVADTGGGMSEESLKRAFEPFFTTRSAEDRPETGVGVGLGLAICREIVRNHQGEIVIKTEPGRGTTFSFYLPVDNDNALIHR